MQQKSTSFSYRVCIDHEKSKTTVDSFIGCKKNKTPVYMSFDISPDTIAQACRCVAYQSLERADELQHNNKTYHSPDVNQQVEIMKYENESYFSTKRHEKEESYNIPNFIIKELKEWPKWKLRAICIDQSDINLLKNLGIILDD